MWSAKKEVENEQQGNYFICKKIFKIFSKITAQKLKNTHDSGYLHFFYMKPFYKKPVPFAEKILIFTLETKVMK